MNLKQWWRLLKNRRKIRYLFSFLTDPKVSLIKKIWVLAPISYLLLPTDLIPDFLIGPGFIDDILVILLFFGKIKRNLKHYILQNSPTNGERAETQNKKINRLKNK